MLAIHFAYWLLLHRTNLGQAFRLSGTTFVEMVCIKLVNPSTDWIYQANTYWSYVTHVVLVVWTKASVTCPKRRRTAGKATPWQMEIIIASKISMMSTPVAKRNWMKQNEKTHTITKNVNKCSKLLQKLTLNVIMQLWYLNEWMYKSDYLLVTTLNKPSSVWIFPRHFKHTN